MKIQVIDCNYLFSECLINEAKYDIKQFHQGFMLVNDKLYLPDHYETTIIDLDDVDKFDGLTR